MDDLVGLGMGLAGTKSSRQVQIHGLGQKARAGVEVQDASPARGGVAGLLQEFALGGGQVVFAFINASGRQFP